MKNIFVASLVSVLLVSAAVFPASALTFSDIQGQIQELLARVASLRGQMDQLRAESGSSTSVPATEAGVTNAEYPHRICAFLHRNLSSGMSGDDVRGVQEFLEGEGLLTVSPTGYFGPVTGQAVAKWQAREGLSAVGTFGPLSRERIKSWCGRGTWNNTERFSATPTRGEAPLTVLFDTWLSGFRPQSIYYIIDFGDGTSERAADCLAPADACVSPGQNKHTYHSRGQYTALLRKVTNPCVGIETLCKAAIHSEIVAKQTITVGPIACTKEYKPVCGSKQVVCITAPCNPIPTSYGNRCEMNSDGATLLYEGQCRTDYPNPADDPRCKSWYDGCNSCSRESTQGPAMCTLRACMADTMTKPYCTAYFDGANRAPTISSFSGPTTISVNKTGTWSVLASDPENGQLTYSISWGDEATVYPYAAAQSAERAFVQTTTFTHSYATPGIYTVSIKVRDSAGNNAEAVSTVSVTTFGAACTEEYAPVCARPAGCMNTCPPGAYCAMMCQMYPARTYSNRCAADVEEADILYVGACTSSDVY